MIMKILKTALITSVLFLLIVKITLISTQGIFWDELRWILISPTVFFGSVILGLMFFILGIYEVYKNKRLNYKIILGVLLLLITALSFHAIMIDVSG